MEDDYRLRYLYFVVLRTLIAMRKIRKDGPVASTAKWFHIHLFVHVLGQVVSQVAMMVCIGVKMDYENRDFSIENTVRISGFLWFMFFGALIVPLAGIFTFAISNFYSVQEYPIGYFLDLLHSSIRRGELGEQSAQESAEVKQSIETGVSSESVAQNIETEFTKIHKRSTLSKYGYVFLSPLLVTLSIVHTLLIFAFLMSYLLEPTVSGQFGVLYSSSTGWTVFFVIACLLVGVPHILVLLVGVVWIVIIDNADCSGDCSGYCLLYMFPGRQ